MKFFLSALAAPLCLTSCANLFLKEKTYETQGGAEINGATVTSAVKGMGGKAGLSLSAMVYSAVAGETNGPFIWRIEARGQEGIHESLTVHSLRVRTEKTQRDEPFPHHLLNLEAPFEPLKGKQNAGLTFAKFQIPGKLEVFPEVDGQITMNADVSIKAHGKTKRKKLEFIMEPKISRKVETVFIPKEIVTSFGAKDPTEWKWNPIPISNGGGHHWDSSGRY